MKIKRKTAGLLVLSMISMLFAGCGTDAQRTGGRSIELLEAKNTMANYEIATRRTIYDADIVAATVYPQTQEYGYEEETEFYDVFKFPGDTVSVGDELIRSDSWPIEDAHYKLQDELYWLTQEHENAQNSIADELRQLKNKRSRLGSGSADYKLVNNKIQQLELQQEEENQLYQLESGYLQKQIDELEKQLEGVSLRSEVNGVVAGMVDVTYGHRAEYGEKVVSIAIDGAYVLKTEYIDNTRVNKAKEIFAVIGGEQVPVTNEYMSTEEYNDLKGKNGAVFSTFYFQEQPESISSGEYASVVLVNEKQENVVSVPKKAVRSDSDGKWLYVLEDGKSVVTPVTTGVSDELYIEILSGVEEGDKILVSVVQSFSDETVVLEKGAFGAPLTTYGYVHNMDLNGVWNDIEYGTMFADQPKVNFFQTVNKGDVVATVRVEPEEGLLQAEEKKLERLKTRFDAALSEGNLEQWEIDSYNEEIWNQEWKIKEIKEDYLWTDVLAPVRGIAFYNYDFYGPFEKWEEIISVADSRYSYLRVEQDYRQLQFGDKVMVSYISDKNVIVEVEGTVVTLGDAGVSGPMRLGYTLIRIPQDYIEEIARSITWDACEIKATVRKMDNVVLVPYAAVKVVGDDTFVNVKNPDGTVTTRSFLSGGNTLEYYWAIEGLTEGMEVCLK